MGEIGIFVTGYLIVTMAFYGARQGWRPEYARHLWRFDDALWALLWLPALPYRIGRALSAYARGGHDG